MMRRSSRLRTSAIPSFSLATVVRTTIASVCGICGDSWRQSNQCVSTLSATAKPYLGHAEAVGRHKWSARTLLGGALWGCLVTTEHTPQVSPAMTDEAL